jgi:hypothetical protein
MLKLTSVYALCLFALCKVTGATFAQTGTVQIYLSPENAWVRLNGEVIAPSPERKSPIIRSLPVGKHQIEIWHKGLQLYKDTIAIAVGESLVYRKGIRAIDTEYAAASKLERKTSQAYQVNNVFFGAGLGLMALFTYQTFGYDAGAKGKKETLINLEKRYATAISKKAIDEIELQYTTVHAEYVEAQKRQRIARATGIPLMIGAGVGSYFAYRLAKKSKSKIVRAEVKNPFVYTPSIQMDGLSGVQFGFTAQF